jgi:hypothetical protein|tara:strand:+ start:792 stop:1229 length:438 start_codon:yes stop_codon:yes gene_type:complete
MATNRCLDTDDGKINFKNYKSVLNGLFNLFKIPMINASQRMPSILILATKAKPGMSPTQIAARIIKRQSEAGLPVGPLPSGQTAPAEIMERIRIEEMVKALTAEARVDVAIQPGTSLQASGGNAGGPIQVVGTVLGIASGNAQIS